MLQLPDPETDHCNCREYIIALRKTARGNSRESLSPDSWKQITATVGSHWPTEENRSLQLLPMHCLTAGKGDPCKMIKAIPLFVSFYYLCGSQKKRVLINNQYRICQKLSAFIPLETRQPRVRLT
jgi:hypothetical protein